MFENMKREYELFGISFKAFKRYPVFMLPLFAAWLIIASVIIYMARYFVWDNYLVWQGLLVILAAVFVCSFFLILSCSVLLEFIQQNETGKSFNLFKSLGETLTKNLLQVLLLSLIWSILWSLVTLVQALVLLAMSAKRTEDGRRDTTYSIGIGAGILLILNFVKETVRMFLFIFMPAFAWEDLSLGKTFKRGWSILKQRREEIEKGSGLTLGASLLVVVPPIIMIMIHIFSDFHFPSWAWVACLVYAGLAWSYTVYLELMFVAELYLWQMNWEYAVRKAEEVGAPAPAFYEVQRPSIIDDTPDLIFA